MSRKWVINASPIISLAKISQIDLLTELCSNLVIPDGVAEEIRQGENDDPAKIWIESTGEKYIKKVMSIPTTISSWDLGLGETHVLSLCYGSLDVSACYGSLDVSAQKSRDKTFEVNQYAPSKVAV